MTQEEKAKNYDRAIERARKLKEDPQSVFYEYSPKEGDTICDYIFPELRESEGEKIRKDIIVLVKDWWDRVNKDNISTKEQMLAWLEKQGNNNNQNWKPSKGQINALEHFVRSIGESGYASPYDDNTKLLFSLLHDLEKLEKQSEQKSIVDFKASNWYVSKVDGKIHDMTYNPADKVEPMFKIGDWVVFNSKYKSIYQIEKIENFQYTLRHILGGSMPLSFSAEDMIRLWTIQDAKDGDVLVNGSNIFIFHFINDTRLMGYCHVNTDDGRFYDDIGKNECFCLIDAVVYPASKEQCDLLFAKMKEAGYQWDAEKKKLNKINSYCQENCKGYQETGKCFADGENDIYLDDLVSDNIDNN